MPPRYNVLVLQLTLLSLVLVPSTLFSSGLEEMFKKLGASSNYTGAGAFKDQSAGHYTAGGLVVRQKNKAISPINIRLPNFEMNCGDFDLRFGGFSFIQAQEMIEMLRRVGTGVPTYAFQLALKTMAPQIEGTLGNIRTFLQRINNIMLSDCRMKQTILEGIAPNQSTLHEKVCQDMQRGGHAEDYTGARKRCLKHSKQEEALKKAKEKYKDLLVGEYNVVWHVIKKMPQYANNKDLAQFIMTVVGTIISKKEGEYYKVTPIPPKGDEKDFLLVYLKGGETEHLECDTNSLSRPHLLIQ